MPYYASASMGLTNFSQCSFNIKLNSNGQISPKIFAVLDVSFGPYTSIINFQFFTLIFAVFVITIRNYHIVTYSFLYKFQKLYIFKTSHCNPLYNVSMRSSVCKIIHAVTPRHLFRTCYTHSHGTLAGKTIVFIAKPVWTSQSISIIIYCRTVEGGGIIHMPCLSSYNKASVRIHLLHKLDCSGVGNISFKVI